VVSLERIKTKIKQKKHSITGRMKTKKKKMLQVHDNNNKKQNDRQTELLGADCGNVSCVFDEHQGQKGDRTNK
jgi:hypothetical protein